MKTHDLKTWPEPFQAVWDGKKPYEVRKDDRGFEVGDRLHLREYVLERDEYTGRAIFAEVTHKLSSGIFLPEGLCVLGIQVLAREVNGERLTGGCEARVRHLLQWLARFEAHHRDEIRYANAEVFSQKVRRVLCNGENSLGVIPCAICGSADNSRMTLDSKAYRILNNASGSFAEIPLSSTLAVCFEHRAQSKTGCACGEELWREWTAKDVYIWFDSAGAAINTCSGCGVRLPFDSKDWIARSREVFTAAGFVRKQKEAVS